jgi:hypothetical protein
MGMDKSWVNTDCSFSAPYFHIPGRQLGLEDGAYCRMQTLRGGRQSGAGKAVYSPTFLMMVNVIGWLARLFQPRSPGDCRLQDALGDADR